VNQFANLDADEDDEVDDEAALAPPPAAAEDLDDEADEAEPIPVPVKKPAGMTLTKAKVVKKTVAK
jgi:hypothetical protein